MDGANRWKIYWSIILPLLVPALSALGIFLFLGSWNEYFRPLIFLNSIENYTVPLMLNALQGPPGRTAYDVLMAGSVVSLVPMLLVFLALQRHLIAGITAGSVKG